MDQPLWQPNEPHQHDSNMQRFIDYCNKQYALNLVNYPDLYQWSIQQKNNFWQAVADFCHLLFITTTPHAFKPGKTIVNAKWFDGATLNFAQNLLQGNAEQIAIIYVDENGAKRQLSYAELRQRVADAQHYLKKIGIKSGDRVVGFMPNCPETIIAMLAATSLGAIWSSCSPDFGEQAVIDRFGQIEPKVLFAITQHSYKGKWFCHREKITRISKAIPSLVETIFVEPQQSLPFEKTTHAIEFLPLPFNHPLYILYSSGTTGKPKCMVHGAGNTLIQHTKELILHTNLTQKDIFFFNTTCGWMMWNWLVSGLFTGCTIVLFEGAPFYPQANSLLNLIDDLGITVFGIGAKYFEALQKEQCKPIKTHSLRCLKTILTTGSPLLPTSFDYIYRDVKHDVQLSSISGGSDIVSCFALGNPLLPVYRGELQCIGLGMPVEIFDANGKAIVEKKGELVCTASFPSMPLYFWHDPDGAKYHHAYFNTFPNVWAHGDYAQITHHQGMIIYGRSDATLNPGGVRVGTAEIYNQVDKIAEVIDAAAVGKTTIEAGETIILFVVLKPNSKLDTALIKKIKQQIRDNTSPFHVPAKIIAAPDLPRTISGKVSELTIKKILHGETINNQHTLANPECLAFFETLNLT